MKQLLKKTLLGNELARKAYGFAQESWFDRDYRRRREGYQARVAGDGRAYSREAAVARARERLAARGYTPKPRQLGEVHTFAYVPSSWQHQNQIASALEKLGPVTRYDYVSRGVRLADLRTRIPGRLEKRDRLLGEMLAALKAAHRERPVDWFFSYALGWDMTAQVLQRIEDDLGIPTVNLSLDDKNWWNEIERGDKESGLVNIAPRYDLGCTSARSVVSWYWAEGGQALFVPEGVNTDWFRPLEVERDIPIGFVGSNFGYRPEIIAALARAGLEVEVHGQGWQTAALDDEAMLRFFNRCQVNLGLGDMHYSRWLTNLKGRDFEVPATGRGVYLTTFNADLATCFTVGREIDCYRGLDELIELLRHHLRNPELSGAMAERARARCLAEHQWWHRYRDILSALGVLADPS